MGKVNEDIQKYADKYPSTHIKNQFFTRVVKLLNQNQLTVAQLTAELEKLTAAERKLLFNNRLESNAAVWISTLFMLLGVPLKNQTLELLIFNQPSDKLISYLQNSRYRLWQKSPFDENKIKNLEHELKGAFGLLSEQNEGKSLANLIEAYVVNLKNEVIPTLLRMAPDYLPVLLDQLYQNVALDDQENFVRRILDIDDPQGNLIHALLHSNPLIVARMVQFKPELYFKASESMQVAVQRILLGQEDKNTLNSLHGIANHLFASDQNDIASQRLKLVLDGSYRYKEVPSGQALNSIQAYIAQQPNDFKSHFFNQMIQDIEVGGLTIELLKNYLSNTDTNKLFDKWSGKENSRSAGLMASLYKLASFGTDLDSNQLTQMVEQGHLPALIMPSKAPGASSDMDWLQTTITEVIKDEANALIDQDQKSQSLKIILNYLAQQPNEYKSNYFSALYRDIETEGFTLDLLKQHLSQADTNELFSKWSGLANSRAADLMAALYRTASFGKNLTPDQMQEMLYLNQLPTELNSKATLLNSKIKEIIMNPHRSNSSFLAKRIGQVFEEVQSKAQFLQNNQYNRTLTVEAAYQKNLLQKGLSLAEKQLNPVFDLQGRVMVFVRLDEQDYQNILAELGQPVEEGAAESTVKSLLKSKITKPSLCNIDIKNNKILETKFKQWIKHDNASALLINSDDRSSVIGLQEELTMHVLLSLRVFEKKIPSLKSESIQQHLVASVNELVQTEFNAAIDKAYSAEINEINYAVLNKELDGARKKLAPLCRQLLVDMVFESNPDLDWDEALSTINKHDFTSTTATGLDYIRSDVRNETLVRISATESTAHDKRIGADTQALRVLYRNHYNQNRNVVSPYPDKSLEARVPSIAVKESAQSIGIKDVADKLQANHLLLREQVAYSNGPMVYNLLTSLHSLAYDNFFFERPNKQRLSAEYILHGSHLYNLRQLRLGEFKAFVYVQNIPVNQHTNELDNTAFDDVTKEATLMTDIALLSTLNHYAGVFPSALQNSISKEYNNAHQLYLDFLPQIEVQTGYFHQSELGKLAITNLNHSKNQWNTVNLQSSNSDSLNSLAVQVLFKMYASNDYRDKQFGMLAQSLSVFVEPLSQAGCKSANERYQGVSGRVELLKSISMRSNAQLSDEEKSVKNVMHFFVKGEASSAQLQQCLDVAYNKHNLYGAAVVFSEEDQGAGSKVKASKNKDNKGVIPISELDTNVAETGFLTRLQQKFCSAMQAHKANLSELFKKLFHDKMEHGGNEIQLK